RSFPHWCRSPESCRPYHPDQKRIPECNCRRALEWVPQNSPGFWEQLLICPDATTPAVTLAAAWGSLGPYKRTQVIVKRELDRSSEIRFRSAVGPSGVYVIDTDTNPHPAIRILDPRTYRLWQVVAMAENPLQWSPGLT